MRIKRSTFCLLTLVCTLAGCSQTGGVRPGAHSSNMRTVASVGDKPLPIVSGEPGASLRAETEELDLPRSSGLANFGPGLSTSAARAVPNAKVRLAVSQLARAVRSSTRRPIDRVRSRCADFVRAHRTPSSPSIRARTA